MKLLLDEMHAPAAATALRDVGHDVLAVAEDLALRSLSDEELTIQAAAEKRAVVTENIADFRQIATSWARTGRPHAGIIYTPASRFPRGNSSYPRDLIRALKQFMKDPPPVTSSASWEWWLS